MQVSSLVAATTEETVVVYIPHVHDEASFRMRSCLAQGTSTDIANFCRTRYSKVLNHDIEVCVALHVVKLLSELQPLSDKTAPTLATGIIKQVVDVIASAMRGLAPASQLKVNHLLTGDAVSTNTAAACYLLAYMRKYCRALGVLYRLVVWLCASHQSNLCVMIAVLGGQTKNAPKQDILCCNASRLFRHLMVDYSEEFARSLWSYVEQCQGVEL